MKGKLGGQAHDSGYELVVETLERLAQAHGEEGIRRFAAAEECVGVDAGGHEV
jgi:hypothetical protein